MVARCDFFRFFRGHARWHGTAFVSGALRVGFLATPPMLAQALVDSGREARRHVNDRVRCLGGGRARMCAITKLDVLVWTTVAPSRSIPPSQAGHGCLGGGGGAGRG